MKENPLRDNLEVERPARPEGPTRYQKCRVLCGRESVVVSTLVLAVGAGNLLIFYFYSRKTFRFNGRKWIWVFFVLATLSSLLVVSFIARTCKAILKHERKVKKLPPTSMAVIVIAHYNSIFDVNGKYYLIKMYAAEALEHFQQVYTLTTFYVCSMPVNISSIVCAVLVVELSINIWTTFRLASQEMRDRLILLDVFTDIFCVAFPLLYTYMSFRIPIGVSAMVSIVAYPSFSLQLKLNDIWEDYFGMDLERIKETGNGRKKGGTFRRISILQLSHNRDTFETQLKHFPPWLRYSFETLNIGFLLFFASLICVHLSTQPSAEKCADIFTEEVWGGCRVRVPFCQDLFVGKCDCAALQMANYTQKSLPESFGNLSSLAKLGIYTGALEELPGSIGDNHKRLVVLEVISNKLGLLPDSVGHLSNLMDLRIQNNQLKSLPTSVGNLRGLVYLDAYGNQLQLLPDSVGQLENLNFLFVQNNKLQSLPDNVGNIKSLLSVRVDNNRLTSLPNSLGNLNLLVALFAWNNSLTSLPNALGNLKSLIVLDVRQNRIKGLPPSANQWSMKYLYLARNPLCTNFDIPSNLKGAKGLCKEQCSVNCPAIWLNDGKCADGEGSYVFIKDIVPGAKPKPDSGCNTAACEYDKGDCPR
jgi:hypothetical protein